MVEGTIESIEVSATPAQVFAVAADLESYEQWATGVKEVEVLEKDKKGRAARARFVVDGMVKEITYVLKYSYDEPNSMTWMAEPGPDLKELDGSYVFNDVGDGRTEVVYGLRVEPSFTIPGFLRRQAEKQLVGTALRGLRKRVEQLARQT
ncbi:MAG: SRPBCC family protein [Actinobacteria bacterium]|nr:SRPBCC family protein [Acidimicrobiia bacterium]MCA1736511.1 SRPBCC family protein [Actinomycetota bacterium]